MTNGTPTGQVFNGTTSFQVPTPLGPRPAVFIFDSQTGDITGWNPANGTTAVVAAHSDDAIYTGLALLQTPAARSCSRRKLPDTRGSTSSTVAGTASTSARRSLTRLCRPATPRSTCRSWAGRSTLPTPCRARTARRRSPATTPPELHRARSSSTRCRRQRRRDRSVCRQRGLPRLLARPQQRRALDRRPLGAIARNCHERRDQCGLVQCRSR